jgi:outer membrane protein OmpA-like peptidoglycan-associated protein
MQIIRKISKLVSVFLAFYMLMLSGPYQSAWAAMIGTESIIKIDRSQGARDYLNILLMREDIQRALVSQGIDPREAKARIDSLSDADVNDIANRLNQLPAGGLFETLLVIVFFIFITLLLTDIAGYTDIFAFVKKYDSKKIKPASEYAEIKADKDHIIYFDHETNELSQKAMEKLDRVAEIILNNPEIEITLNGYSDSTGSPSYNKMISESRANVVKVYLIGKGLKPSKITIRARGAENFVGSNETEEGRRLNRRVEIEFNSIKIN